MIGLQNKNKTIKQLGLSLIEALIATGIVGIGFVAIFQMAKYSVESMSISSDRTKANYLVSMVAEDLVGNRHAKIGNDVFVDYLRKSNHAFQVKGCKKAYTRKSDMNEEEKNLYYNQRNNAPENKIRKWNNLFSSDKIINCKGKDTKSTDSAGDTTTVSVTKDTKALRIITMCDLGCDHESPGVYDKMYMGRMQINMNDGKKKKYLYFQTHYVMEE